MRETIPPLLEIAVYLTDGRTVHFFQNDAEAVQHLKDHLNPARFFQQETIIIGGSKDMTAFPTAHVVRVDLKSAVLSDTAHLPGIARVREMTADEFQATDLRTPPLDRAFAEMELSGGNVLYHTLYFDRSPDVQELIGQRTVLDQAAFINNLFSGQAFHGELADRGIYIVNPARILRFTFHPTPPVFPVNAWRAERAE
jgi:hypothetical protein